MSASSKPKPLAARDDSLRDPEVLAQIAAGDIGALGTLYDRYHEPVRRFVARATSDADDVDDLVHATFLAAVNGAPSYDGRPCCRPWLVGIAVHLLRRRRRSFKHLMAVLSSLHATRRIASEPRGAWEARLDVEQALRSVSEAQRVAFLLAEAEGWSCPEIAAFLGIPVGTVWTRLHAARRELRRALHERDEA